MKTLLFSMAIIMLVSCGSPVISTRTVPPPKLDEYVDLPFNKFINRMYLDEVKDKYVRIEADFGGLHSSHNVGGYPADQWVKISIIKGTVAYDNIMVPKSEAEICFNLKRGEPIIIYAKTTVWSKSYAGRKQPDEIALIVTKIERQQTKDIVRLPDLTGWKLINITDRKGVEVKTYHNDGKTLIISYKGGKPIGFMNAPIPQGQNMITYCDKDGDGIFETILTNNPDCN